jgi:hypothetical protein
LYFFVHHAPQRSGLFKITKAAITPGTHPQRVSKKTIIIDPQPWSITASGGNKIDKSTRQKLNMSMLYAKIGKFDSGLL